MNGIMKDAVETDGDCAAECLAIDSCVGYSYTFAQDSSHFRRCNVYGPRVDAGVPVFVRGDTAEPVTSWHGRSYPDTEIVSGSGSDTALCYRRAPPPCVSGGGKGRRRAQVDQQASLIQRTEKSAL